METELISLRELARRIGKDPDTIAKWRDREGLPVYRINAHYQAVVWGEYLDWLHARTVHNRSLSVMRSA